MAIMTVSVGTGREAWRWAVVRVHILSISRKQRGTLELARVF